MLFSVLPAAINNAQAYNILNSNESPPIELICGLECSNSFG